MRQANGFPFHAGRQLNPLSLRASGMRARILRKIFVTQFNQLGLAEPILKALAAKGYGTPTPIQLQAIPVLLDGRDLCGIAQTGTGKTAAFALPSLDRLAANPRPRPPQGCRMLVLSPTRELASQIAQSFVDYGKFLRLSVATVFGGVPIGRQMRQLQAGVDILVATPGRLLDLIDQRALSLRHVEIFVLDEADQMLDLGFIHALKRIDQLLPKQRQSLFFSATMPKAIADLGDRFLTDPVKVSVAPQATTAERVDQFATFVNQSEKQALLTMKIKGEPIDRALVFTRTKHGADRVVKHLKAAGIGCEAIHGNKSQPQRERALGQFRTGEIRILVATDIAARGIDVGGVSHVFNFELPNVPEQYVHRIGRTARAGREGIAIAFVAEDERAYLRQIEKLTRVKCAIQPLPENFLAEAARLPKPAQAMPTAQRRHEEAREQRHGAGAEQPKRRFPARRRGGVGAHKAAVRKTGGR
jgi:ATP-dependent RNA helicase RhlE